MLFNCRIQACDYSFEMLRTYVHNIFHADMCYFARTRDYFIQIVATPLLPTEHQTIPERRTDTRRRCHVTWVTYCRVMTLLPAQITDGMVVQYVLIQKKVKQKSSYI